MSGMFEKRKVAITIDQYTKIPSIPERKMLEIQLVF
jgi:hypothetical protein